MLIQTNKPKHFITIFFDCDTVTKW